MKQQERTRTPVPNIGYGHRGVASALLSSGILCLSPRLNSFTISSFLFSDVDGATYSPKIPITRGPNAARLFSLTFKNLFHFALPERKNKQNRPVISITPKKPQSVTQLSAGLSFILQNI